jgi:hypothetical protein
MALARSQPLAQTPGVLQSPDRIPKPPTNTRCLTPTINEAVIQATITDIADINITA